MATHDTRVLLSKQRISWATIKQGAAVGSSKRGVETCGAWPKLADDSAYQRHYCEGQEVVESMSMEL
jgi:hypothetical protein